MNDDRRHQRESDRFTLVFTRDELDSLMSALDSAVDREVLKIGKGRWEDAQAKRLIPKYHALKARVASNFQAM